MQSCFIKRNAYKAIPNLREFSTKKKDISSSCRYSSLYTGYRTKSLDIETPNEYNEVKTGRGERYGEQFDGTIL